MMSSSPWWLNCLPSPQASDEKDDDDNDDEDEDEEEDASSFGDEAMTGSQ